MDCLISLARDLHAATSFEHASDATLAAAIDLASKALAASKFAEQGKLLRATVHLRPDDGYLRLVVLDVKLRGAGARIGDETDVSSATAWRWVREHGVPIAIDVGMQMVLTLEDEGFAPPAGEANEVDLNKSRLKLAGRDVTHLLAVPLRLSGGRIEGMIAIEAACPQARATSFIWDACAADLEKLATMAAPYLCALPITRVSQTRPDNFLPVIGTSMQRIVEMLRVFAKQEETVLLSGPTGAGKSRLAQWCHEHSRRRGQPFETVDLATVPEELQMGALFGWGKGAFTGAEKATPGAIARAEGGTLFIDEIDKLSMKAQAGLLRILEERQYHPLGAGAKKANVRFVIGTNADLVTMTKNHLFREDLYYRINVLPVRVLRLAERADEIVPWARYMLQRHHDMNGNGGTAELSDDGARKLERQEWPGNLRQLDNIVRRAYALALVDLGNNPGNIVIGGAHVDRALLYETGTMSSVAWGLFERAAEGFVVEAERCFKEGQPLDVDLVEGIKGLVIEIAMRRIGGEESEALRKAFIMLGKEAAVRDRNQRAVFKREQAKRELLHKALDPGEKGK